MFFKHIRGLLVAVVGVGMLGMVIHDQPKEITHTDKVYVGPGAAALWKAQHQTTPLSTQQLIANAQKELNYATCAVSLPVNAGDISASNATVEQGKTDLKNASQVIQTAISDNKQGGASAGSSASSAAESATTYAGEAGNLGYEKYYGVESCNQN